MCGISGIFSLSGAPVPLHAIEKMNLSLSHRGPDGRGHAVFPFNSPPIKTSQGEFTYNQPCWAALSQNRLAIIDLSDKGAQPMPSGSGKSWITFNGEIYNYIELKKELKTNFISNSDTEVLLETWEREGENCLNKLNGMWALAIVSVEKKELFLSRDRFGKKPLYYALTGDFLVFASEIKAIFASGLVKKEFVRETVEDYLSYGVYVVQGKETFYKNIYKLPPSCFLKASPHGGILVDKYYRLPELPKLRLKDAIEESKIIFEDSTRLRLRSDVPVASCLSGGIDSTNVISYASKELKRTGSRYVLNAYTIDPGDRMENETLFAKEVAEKNNCKWNLVKLPAELDTANVIDFIITNEEPQEFLGSIVQYLLYKKISADGYKVIVDGQGGDEVFAGYHWLYYLIYQDALKRKEYLKLLPWLVGVYLNGNNSIKKIKDDGILYGNPLLNKSKSKFSYLFNTVNIKANSTLNVLTNCNGWKEQQQAIFFNLELQSLLRDSDRNGMRWGLEDRLPFLDFRLLELAQRVDPLDLTHLGYSKYIARNLATNDMVPEHIRWSKFKKGFYIDVNNLFPKLETVLKDMIPHAKQTTEIIDWKYISDNLGKRPLPLWRLFNVLILDISGDLQIGDKKGTLFA